MFAFRKPLTLLVLAHDHKQEKFRSLRKRIWTKLTNWIYSSLPNFCRSSTKPSIVFIWSLEILSVLTLNSYYIWEKCGDFVVDRATNSTFFFLSEAISILKTQMLYSKRYLFFERKISCKPLKENNNLKSAYQIKESCSRVSHVLK